MNEETARTVVQHLEAASRANQNYVLMRKSYQDGINDAIRSILRRINSGEFAKAHDQR